MFIIDIDIIRVVVYIRWPFAPLVSRHHCVIQVTPALQLHSQSGHSTIKNEQVYILSSAVKVLLWSCTCLVDHLIAEVRCLRVTWLL